MRSPCLLDWRPLLHLGRVCCCWRFFSGLIFAVGSSTAGILAARGALFSRMLVFGALARSPVTECLQSGPSVCPGCDLGLSLLHNGHSKTVGSTAEYLHSPSTLVCSGEC